jgi:subtilisin family serine protease
MYFCDTGYTVNGDSPAMVIQYNFSDPIYPSGGQEAIFDCGRHGTETATVTAFSDNHTGFTGMANLSGQRVMMYELRISADGQTAGMLNILTAISAIANNPGFLPGPINLSFNLPPPNSLNGNASLQQAALQLVQRGFLLVLASGNDSMYDPSPEMYMRRVAAITQAGTLASYSNSGAFNTAAPGQNVACYTPAGGTSQTTDNGTSFAAPRWCAAVAVVMGIMQPGNRSAVTADWIIRQTGTYNSQGFLVPNMGAAVQYAMGSP